MSKHYKVTVTCRADSWELVVKEFMDLYLYCEVSVIPYDVVKVSTTLLDYDPKEDGQEFALFADAVRNYANNGWPENDPLEIEEYGAQ